MPNYREIPGVSEGDQSWLGSTRGIYTNRTERLDVSAFTVDPELGYIPSGTPVAKVGDVLVPFAAAGTGGTNVLEGFIFTDQVVGVDDEINVPLMDFGRIRTPRLPVAFDPATVTASNGNFVFIP